MADRNTKWQSNAFKPLYRTSSLILDVGAALSHPRKQDRGGNAMPKYMIQASYTAEGLKGLQKDKASGRRAAVSKAAEVLGGKLEDLCCACGHADLVPSLGLPAYGS